MYRTFSAPFGKVKLVATRPDPTVDTSLPQLSQLLATVGGKLLFRVLNFCKSFNLVTWETRV
jgi:hypothetical protein